MPRRNLAANTAWDDINGYLTHVEVALALAADDGDKEIAVLLPTARKLQDKWQALDSDRRAGLRDVIRANALVGLRDVALDGVTTKLHHATLGHVEQNRKAPLFTLLFPKPLSQVVALYLEAQLGVSRTLLHKLEQSETPALLRTKHAKPLAAAIAAGEAAIKQREAAQAAGRQIAMRISTLRDESNSALLIIEGQLKTLAGKRGLGTAFVNAFFPAAKSTAKKPAKKPPAPTPA